MVSTLLKQKLARKEETRKRGMSNQIKESTVGSSKRERADSQTPKKRKRHAVIESDDKDGQELKSANGSDSDSRDSDSEESEYEIEKILDKFVENGLVYYKVLWKSYPPEDAWDVLESNVNAPELIREYEQEQQRVQRQSSERNTSSSQLPSKSRSECSTSNLPNKVVNQNVAKAPRRGSTSLPREKSASVNPPLQESAQKSPSDTVAKSPSKQDALDVLTSRTLVKELPTRPMMPVRKEALASSNDGLFLLGKKKFETTAGLHPKERMTLQERREKEVQAVREKRMSTEDAFDAHPEAPTSRQPTAASTERLKEKQVPPSRPAVSEDFTSTTVASIRQDSEISSSVKTSLPKEKQIDDKIKSKTNELTSMATSSKPQDNRMPNGEASTAISLSLTRQEANPSVTKTIRKNVKARVAPPFEGVITKTTNDGDNSQLSEMYEENANQREEEHWRRGKEQERQKSFAKRMQEAEEKKRLEAQKSAKASKETVYDPRAVSSSNNDNVFDPRAVKNHEASTSKVSLPRKNSPSLPPCLLDRGIKIEKIEKLFLVDDKLAGLCKFKNCVEMQIITVEKIKKVDPVALLQAYEPLFWGTQTNEYIDS